MSLSPAGTASTAGSADGISHGPLRVLLADADPRVRSALRLLVEQELAGAVCAEAASADSLAAMMRTQPPDVLVLDWDLAASTSAPLSSLCCAGRRPAIVALGHDTRAEPQAHAAGADWFLSKTQPPERVLTVLRLVAAHQKTTNRETKKTSLMACPR